MVRDRKKFKRQSKTDKPDLQKFILSVKKDGTFLQVNNNKKVCTNVVVLIQIQLRIYKQVKC